MVREAVWARLDSPGLEYLRLLDDDAALQAHGTVIGIAEGRPYALTYLLRWDLRWHVRSLQRSLPAMAAGQAVIYALGLIGLGLALHWPANLLQLGLTPFLVGDAIKLVAAALLLPAAWRILPAR